MKARAWDTDLALYPWLYHILALGNWEIFLTFLILFLLPYNGNGPISVMKDLLD